MVDWWHNAMYALFWGLGYFAATKSEDLGNDTLRTLLTAGIFSGCLFLMFVAVDMVASLWRR